MLADAVAEVVGHANVNGAAGSALKYVDVEVVFAGHIRTQGPSTAHDFRFASIMLRSG